MRGRIDWKYALGLAFTDSGFDHTVLSKFRTRLVAGGAELLLLDTLLLFDQTVSTTPAKRTSHPRYHRGTGDRR